jgi:hypothetical protein
MPAYDWTIDTAARIAENDDYLVSLYDIADGEFDIAYVRPKTVRALDGAAQAAREALIAFDLAMHRR